jgi:hypothetical protein
MKNVNKLLTENYMGPLVKPRYKHEDIKMKRIVGCGGLRLIEFN